VSCSLALALFSMNARLNYGSAKNITHKAEKDEAHSWLPLHTTNQRYSKRTDTIGQLLEYEYGATMASRSQPKRAVKRKLEVQSTSSDKSKKQASAAAPAPAIRVFPSTDEPTSIFLPFNGFTIVISLPDVTNASAEDIQQFKGLIPQLERAFTHAALWPAPQFEEITLRTDVLPFTFSCVPLTLRIPDHENASFEAIEEYSQVVAHIMSFFQQEASKPQKRGRGRPRASSVVARRRALSVDSVASDQSTESQTREAIRGTIKQAIYKERDAMKKIPPHLVGDVNKYPSKQILLLPSPFSPLPFPPVPFPSSSPLNYPNSASEKTLLAQFGIWSSDSTSISSLACTN